MSEIVDRLKAFVAYAQPLTDEKGEAQVFCDRLFQAFGHAGYKEAGATLEFRVSKKGGKGKKFADLMWKPHALIEMKSADEKLHLHYQQAFDYWLAAVPNRPRYVVLCNFREFWVYDFDKQMGEPVDKLSLNDLPQRYPALNFLFPHNPKPIFGNDREDVSRDAADKMADLFRTLTKRAGDPVPRQQAQRFVLQLLVAMFAEDIDLLPAAMVKRIVDDCTLNGQSAYDLFGGLFRQMNDPNPAQAGRFKGVRYFNGGLFSTIDPVELRWDELELIGKDDEGAATKNWSKVNPAIFGTIFQESMDSKQRHAYGAHYTAEADIQRIVGPTIVRPWRERIDAAKSLKDLVTLRGELSKFRVLDPACGSGNFLYVAYREMTRLDLRILQRMSEIASAAEFAKRVKTLAIVNPKQFYGIELDHFGVELAKVTLMLAKKLALDEARETIGELQGELDLAESALPLDNLDENFQQGDALFLEWPETDAVIGNPPYQSKNKLQDEAEPGYANALRERYPDVDGRADYCTYWFRRAHDHLKPGDRAGLVGTNTIRQNYSREASLDYIADNGGTITEAVSSMVWPGKAVVHVSVVNWVKGKAAGLKHLFVQNGNKAGSGERLQVVQDIDPALSGAFDVRKAKPLRVNKAAECYQGQTHGHNGFLVKAENAQLALKADKTGRLQEVLKPFLIAADLIGQKNPSPRRYVIDFRTLDALEAREFQEQFAQVEAAVLPARKKAAEKERLRNEAVLAENPDAAVNKHHANFLRSWWRLSYARGEMIEALSRLSRYVVCGQVTKRPIFAFVSSSIRPNAALQVFAYEDDYSFGILQSEVHWEWFKARCSTLKSDFRYTSNTVWDSFPWPQDPGAAEVKAVAAAAVQLRSTRSELLAKHTLSLRELYRTLDAPGEHPLKAAHAQLDSAVRAAYGMPKNADPLSFLLELNAAVFEREQQGQDVQGPGLPRFISDHSEFVTRDCLVA